MNATIEKLIDDLGPPPAEVAVDWACQLLEGISEQDESNDPVETGVPDWAEIQVDSEGRLVADSITPAVARAAIGDLLAWSGSTDDEVHWRATSDSANTNSFADIASMRRAVLQRAQELTKHAAAITAVNNKSASTVPIRAASGVKRSTRSSRRTGNGTDSPKRSSAWKGLALGVPATLLVVLGFWWMWPSSEESNTAAVSDGARMQSANDAEGNGGLSGRKLPDQEDDVSAGPLQTTKTNDSGVLSSTSDVAEITALEDLSGFATDPALPTDQDEPRAESTEGPAKELTPGTPNALETLNGAPTLKDSSQTQEGVSDDASDVSEIDVTAQLQQLVDSTRGDEADSETTLEVHSKSAAGVANQPALALAVFPSKQTMELSLDKAIRLRKPALNIELRVADAVKITPENAQVVTSSQPTFWSITSDESDEIGIRVAAKLTGGRRPRILWQIAGVPTQLPAFSLPLSKQYLNRGQDLLARLRSQLNLGIESLRQSNVPSELRSLVNARRQAAERQLKLCESYLSVFVAASRIVGLMDGQIEVHGSLFDEAADGQPAISIFGQPSTINRESPSGGEDTDENADNSSGENS